MRHCGCASPGHGEGDRDVPARVCFRNFYGESTARMVRDVLLDAAADSRRVPSRFCPCSLPCIASVVSDGLAFDVAA
ncbi:hypothetical protein Y032_0351g3230 [Ancylostoma ceylanicum]|uniref:Uncharacterized protein n=1 Tax=Ancylostoma ceylanicum TaxID=53326 RepID=A0A016RWK3_9BILA|nr:hypothetical protein Y032_0351g3230 [Ancylostoma ceylanicum]